MARKKKAWGPSNPLWRYLHRGKAKSRRVKGGTMAKKKGTHRARGGFGGGSDMIDAGLAGMGAAALTKRFIGAPLGGFSGAAAGAAYAYIKHKNLLGAALGGYVHDNIGNVGGASSSGVPVLQ